MNLLIEIIIGTIAIFGILIFIVFIWPLIAPRLKDARVHARGELTDEERQGIAYKYLIEPIPEKLRRSQRKRSDRVMMITNEMIPLTFAYKTFPDVFMFRGKRYPIYPGRILTVRTKWRKIAIRRLYVLTEGDMIPVGPDPSKSTTGIEKRDPKTGEVVKNQEGKPEYLTNKEVHDWVNGLLTEGYTKNVYGAVAGLLTSDKILFYAFGLMTGLAVLGIVLGVHGGAL